MKPAMSRGLRKAGRTLIRLVAAGGLTALVDLAAHGLSPEQAAAIMIVWGTVVSFLHNYLETAGAIPAFLPSPGLVTTTAGGAITRVVGTTDTVVQAGNQVVGDVLSTTGKVVGAIAGPVGDLGAGGA